MEALKLEVPASLVVVEKSGLECNHFELRMYDPVIGRWTTIDPMGEFWSPYVAFGNNPINFNDPSGGMTDDPPAVQGIGLDGAQLSVDYNFDQIVANSGLSGPEFVGEYVLSSLEIQADYWSESEEKAFRKLSRLSARNLSHATGRHAFLEQSFIHNIKEGAPEAFDLWLELNGLKAGAPSDNPYQVGGSAPFFGRGSGVPKLIRRSSIGGNRVHHIMQARHAWHKLMANPTWSKVEALINQTLVRGTSVPYKGVSSKIMYYKGFHIQVTFKKINNVIHVSDAWIITR